MSNPFKVELVKLDKGWGVLVTDTSTGTSALHEFHYKQMARLEVDRLMNDPIESSVFYSRNSK